MTSPNTLPHEDNHPALELKKSMTAPPIKLEGARQESPPPPPSTADSIEAQKLDGLLDSEASCTARGPTSAFERRLVWKIDLFILPILITINSLGQMGRSDIANAKIAGMGEERLSARGYAVSAFAESAGAVFWGHVGVGDGHCLVGFLLIFLSPLFSPPRLGGCNYIYV